jgi:hypothetical protein
MRSRSIPGRGKQRGTRGIGIWGSQEGLGRCHRTWSVHHCGCARALFVRSFVWRYVRGVPYEANGFTCLVSVLDVDGGGTLPSKTEQSLWGRRKH